MTARSNARRKAAESGENPTARSSNAPPILSSWSVREQRRSDHTGNSPPAVSATDSQPADQTDRCFDKARLARFLGLSVRSLDRANAAGLLPCPDLICGRSPRWSPSTIERWLRTKPRLPGRKEVNRGQ